ncbi:helix-turn-helix transcriptional regulator [Aerococcaceae bacterium INB8]|uniref:Helix-turn-helix transcriptional regulator n=3 Tax=Ruoffia TaxID=2862144 RepID=A0A839A778_9LACT|nr:helix-turn-helix transcriptional regulator [Ruoffia halotolerans]MBA5730109.1 helix-turn-helix transcriptional regulator [Ruoffia halotolerans]
MQSLGPIFRNLRLEKQLTLKDTAKGIVSQPFLSNFETGKSGISADKLFALLQRLKVSPEEFYRLASFYNSVSIYEF